MLVNKTKDYNLGYAAAVLNSALLSAFHRTFCKVKRAGYLEFSGGTISELPIRTIEFATPIAERRRYLQQLVSQYDAALKCSLGEEPRTVQGVPSGFTDLLAAIGEPGEVLRIPLDVLHDLLARLAEEMIEANRSKQAKTKHFVSWIEGALRLQPDKKGDATVESLRSRTVLKGYLGDYQKGEGEQPFEAILEVLRKNAKRLGISLNDPRPLGRVREEYEKSLAVLLPIKRRLAATDWLIDQVVYRLYGMTEEEIRIVERAQ
jgi:hypothetical protein